MDRFLPWFCCRSAFVLISILCLLQLFSFSSIAEQNTQTKITSKAVVLFSYRQGWWAVQEENRGLTEGLEAMGFVEGKNIEITRLYMNTKTVNKTSEQREKAASDLIKQIKKESPDILFIMDDDALKHVGAKFLGAQLPVIFGGINLMVTDPDYGWVTPALRKPLAKSLDNPGFNFTGVLERIAIRSGFNVLHQIVPSARTALFLSDNSELSHQLLRSAGDVTALQDLPIKIVKQLFTDDYELMQKSVLEYQEKVDCIIMLLPWTFEDSAGQHIPQEKVMQWLLQHNRKPGIAYLDILAEEGFVCGVVVDMKQQGVHAGIMGGRILKGASPATLPIVDPVANRIMINLARAEQLQIDIPFEVLKNTDVIFKSMSVFPGADKSR